MHAFCRVSYAILWYTRYDTGYGFSWSDPDLVIAYWISMNMPYDTPYPVWKCLPYGSTHPLYRLPQSRTLFNTILCRLWPNSCCYNTPTDIIHAQLCSEWPSLRYWSPVQIFCYQQINNLRQNLYLIISVLFVNNKLTTLLPIQNRCKILKSLQRRILG